MVGKAGWWSYFGNWNFQNNSSTPLNYVEGQGVVIPSNETGLSNNTTVIIANNAVFAHITDNNVTAGIVNVNQLQSQNMSTPELVNQLLSGLQGNSSLVVQPHRLIVMQNNNITQNDIISNESKYSIVIINTNGTYTTYLMNRELEDSMFTRLYVLRGQNVSQFTLNYEQPGVMVWKVV
jgi:dolichyl-diphosphooligosaccharide--protein glycosyltransferase